MTSFHRLPDGTRLAYTEAGVGQPVVFLHGVLASKRFFERNLATLAQTFRVIAIDFRGHGDSDDSQGGNTVAQFARDLDHFLATKELADVIAVGWSMGNFVIWDYLEEFGANSRISAQICISQGPTDLISADWPHGFTDHVGLRDMVRTAQEDYAVLCAHVVTLLTHELPGPEDCVWMVEEQLKLLPNSAACILTDQTQRDYRAFLPSLAIPVLGIWGADEKAVSLKTADWMRANVPDFTLEIFGHSGHMPMWEEAGRFNNLVTSWIRDGRSIR
ncbi:alpha/beta fold hydrolase [Labrys monachus]|uniref:Pimeloyl-ACP methyl ester carboxylesterase n=1 Tax=Labrys monachus TaxID=217067 RepID=A0ABU0FAZ5_9HYPH|nr:alpha/beta hydrolase [Labrys monachus]MDQ0391793.1 pimeloyl-ACP methyl ester carboxylesterase [Labrys monachus]